MKLKPIIIVLLSQIAMVSYGYTTDCTSVYGYAEEAYAKAVKGNNSDNLDDAEVLAMQVMSAAQDAMYAAEECRCDDAYVAADDTLRYARNAYQVGDYNQAIDYLRKAKFSAADVMTYADGCGT